MRDLIHTLRLCIAVGLDALFCWLAFRAVGANVAFPIVLFGYTFYNLAYMLPITPMSAPPRIPMAIILRSKKTVCRK